MSATRTPVAYPTTLRVIGVGGGGGNAVRHLLDTGHTSGLDLIVANTDRQALLPLPQEVALPIGRHTTHGLGAGADCHLGREAAEESRRLLGARLAGTDLLFLVAGMGGGTGSGAAPVIAALAREMGVLTVALVTRPFGFEGARRQWVAEAAIAELAAHVDALLVVPNDRLLPTLGPDTSLLNAFDAVNEVLGDTVSGIADLLAHPGMLNLDLADLGAVMRGAGRGQIGIGRGTGADRAHQAVRAAMADPLLETAELNQASGVLVSITAGPDLSLEEFEAIASRVATVAGDEARVAVGTAIDPGMSGTLRVVIVVTGLRDQAIEPTRPVSPLPPTPLGEWLDIIDFLEELKDK